jgi:hypothetical protein
MKMRIALLVIALMASFPAAAQTVDEIVSKALEARGGVERIKALQSQRLTGRISFGPDNAGPLLVEMKRPGKMRDQVTVDGKTWTRTTDGRSGWVMGGGDDPRPMSAEELRNTAGSADFEGPLVDYAAKGNKIELIGKDKVEGKDAYKLKVTLKDGQVRYDYIDAVSYLELKWEGSILYQGKELGVETVFRDYRKVDGLVFSFLLDSFTPETSTKQQIVLEKVEVNPPEDDARFGRLALPPAAAKQP